MRIQFLMVPLLLITLGCADNGPPLVKVEGTVNLDGVPLPFKNIMFHPEDKTPGAGAGGNTDIKGYFNVLAVRPGLPATPSVFHQDLIGWFSTSPSSLWISLLHLKETNPLLLLAFPCPSRPRKAFAFRLFIMIRKKHLSKLKFLPPVESSTSN